MNELLAIALLAVSLVACSAVNAGPGSEMHIISFDIDLEAVLQIPNKLPDGDSTSHLISVPYQIAVDSGIVTTIREQYVP
jgi:hypothetical protein